MLIVVLRGEGMRRVGVPIQIRDRLVGQENSRSWRFRIFRKGLDERWIRRIELESVRICPGNHAFLGASVVEEGVGNGINLARRSPDRGTDIAIRKPQVIR